MNEYKRVVLEKYSWELRDANELDKKKIHRDNKKYLRKLTRKRLKNEDRKSYCSNEHECFY